MRAVTSTTALWFHIETLFTEVQELCVQARAAQLALEQVSAQPKLLKKTMASSVGALLAAEEPPLPEEQDPRFARASALAKDLAFREENPNGANLVALREQIRKRLLKLKARFAEVLTERESLYAAYPIVIYFDELVQLGSRGAATRWEPLQSELYDIDNGGEKFFELLDDGLMKQETHPLILEIYYFCLADGFLGMHMNDLKRIEEYKFRLVERIPLAPVPPGDVDKPKPVELISFPWQYYAVAVAAVLAVYLIFSQLASIGTGS